MSRARCTVFLLLLLSTSGCLLHRHTVGDGPHGGEVRVHRQWYAMWGWVPMGSFDSSEVVGAASDYRVTTKYGVRDHFVNLFTFPFTFVRRTVVVEM